MNQFNSKGGEQNIAQGDHAIGKQVNNFFCRLLSRIFTTGDQSPAIVAGGNVSVSYNNSPPAPLPTIPHNLPSLDTCFLGRDKQLAELLPLLHPGKVVAVCGPGGMGKSALAAQAVHQLEPARFPDGIIFHSFYSHPRIEQALQRIAKAFCIEAKPSLEIAVADALAGKKALLILDGAEEADDLPALLKLRGACGVLITSRKRSDALADRLDLKPLEEEAAAAVFRQYSGVAADDASVQGICKILDGWPVGLRIAGRYCSSTGESTADYLRFLSKVPFRRLASGEHQEENAALLLRRSVAKVSADARLALGLAGCLAFAPLAREPVMAVLDGDELRSADALGELVNYGLLEKCEERWQVSHALVHTYARTELPMSKESLERLAAWYIDFCQTQSAAGVKGYAILDGERAHCLRLIESCLANKLLKEVKGLDRALPVIVHNIKKESQRLDISWIYMMAMERAYEQSQMMAQGNSDWKEEDCPLNNLAMLVYDQGDYETALQYFKQALFVRGQFGNKKGIETTLTNIAMVYRAQGDYAKALECYHKALAIRQEHGDRAGEALTRYNLGLTNKNMGDLAKAEDHISLAVQIAEKIGHPDLEQWREGLEQVRAARQG